MRTNDSERAFLNRELLPNSSYWSMTIHTELTYRKQVWHPCKFGFFQVFSGFWSPSCLILWLLFWWQEWKCTEVTFSHCSWYGMQRGMLCAFFGQVQFIKNSQSWSLIAWGNNIHLSVLLSVSQPLRSSCPLAVLVLFSVLMRWWAVNLRSLLICLSNTSLICSVITVPCMKHAGVMFHLLTKHSGYPNPWGEWHEVRDRTRSGNTSWNVWGCLSVIPL